MNFWISAVALLAISAAVMSWPLFTGSMKDRINGILMVLIVPVIGLVLYQSIGTPEALRMTPTAQRQAAQSQEPHTSGQADIETLVAQLQQRMNENPDDPEGWLMLGRTLKSMQRFGEAEAALTTANRLLPGNPMIMVELAETRLFASGSPEISAETKQLIESALEIDPQLQKGLWLLGMVFSQEGDETSAIEIWERLLAQLDPASGPAQAVTQQIELARTRMGQPATEVAVAEKPAAETSVAEAATAKPVVAVTTVAESGIPVTITIADEFAQAVPGNATLFIFIHPAGGAGMPLAVKRLAARGFPMSMNFSDADLLRPGTSLQDFEKLDVSARISISGIANAASGDYQANKVTLDTNAIKPIALHLDQRVP